MTAREWSDRGSAHLVPVGQRAALNRLPEMLRTHSKYLNLPLKRRVLTALDTLRQNLEMVDATGLTPLHR